MKQLLCAAPARPYRGCAGVFVLLIVLQSCERAPFTSAKPLDVGEDTIQLAPGVVVHDVQVGAAGNSEFTPTDVQVRAGDVVRFTATDSRTHMLTFDETSLPGNARVLFETKSQLRSPPLVMEGAIWIISLAEAPAGTYSFVCSMHGTSGRIVVR